MSKNNNIHLDGILEAFAIVDGNDKRCLASASVITLHAKPDMPEGTSPSELYDRLHHDIEVVAKPSDRNKLEVMGRAFAESKEKGSVFPCSLDGFLFSDGSESFVVCKAEDFRKTDTVKTSANNRVNIVGVVSSFTYTDETADIKIKTDEGIFSTFISRRENLPVWEMVSNGKIAKGDTLVLSGPLLSRRMTDGKTVLRSCMLSPHVFQKQKLEHKIPRKGGPSVG